ncbi:MAG TPA: tetratricopeptide repeat protein [Chitinophagales bacterium]|nr:tetratricopeptide repeat protein [Chitinophagales bacterium]
MELFSQANQLYKEKNYESAIVLYDSIVKSGYSSAELFFNLGNAHYKLGHLAPAILNYERAKKLAPSDEDIDFNLRIANLRVVDRVEPLPELFFVRWVKNIVIRHSSDGWAKLALLLLWAAFLCAMLFLFASNILLKRTGVFAAILALLLALASAFTAYSQYNYQRTRDAAIVGVKNVYIKSAPDPQSTDLFMLREGVKVKLLEAEGEWQKIQLVDGKVGWMRKEGLEVI